jgi:hypothetical protein
MSRLIHNRSTLGGDRYDWRAIEWPQDSQSVDMEWFRPINQSANKAFKFAHVDG